MLGLPHYFKLIQVRSFATFAADSFAALLSFTAVLVTIKLYFCSHRFFIVNSEDIRGYSYKIIFFRSPL